MKLFIDTEFNGFNGQLISMGIVDENEEEFYEVLPLLPLKADPWVLKNVLPILNKEPISPIDFSEKLQKYLLKYRNFILIADWPEDITHFTQQIITGPGKMMNLPSFRIEFHSWLRSSQSKIPHNALEDAKAIKEMYQQNEKART